MLGLRATRFNEVIPLTDKQVIISSLLKQCDTILRKDVDESSDVSMEFNPGAATATANKADKTTNTFIFNKLN